MARRVSRPHASVGCGQGSKPVSAALRRALDASAAAIISAETLWGHSPEELARLRDFLLREGFEPRVIAYIRPHRSYVESGFQQAMRFDHDGFRPARRAGESWKLPLPDAADRLGRFEATFGRDRLTVRPFRGGSLVGGCAVRDFCQTLGIDLAAASIIRSNESLSADAVRLLYCYNRFARRDRPPSFHASLVLLDSLKDLPGRPFRLHPDVTAPISEAIDRHDREVLDRFGVDLREGPRTEDGSAVRDETDLFRLAPESLEWLARNSGLGPIAPGDGEAVARAVAGRVAALARGPSLYARIDRLRRAARRSVRWLRRGD